MAPFEIAAHSTADHHAIRFILQRIGWEERYITAFEQTAQAFATRNDAAVFGAKDTSQSLGFLFVEHHSWNQLAQIQGLAVDPATQRRGVASALVARAEAFAQSRQARGIYVDTPTTNSGGRSFYEARGYQVGYFMPRYYANDLDGVTYQKFFTTFPT